jgi:hypothetical protein
MPFSTILSPPSELRRRSVVAPTLHDDVGAFDREAQPMDKSAVTASHFIVFRLPWDDNLLTLLNRWIRAFPCVHGFINNRLNQLVPLLGDGGEFAF